MFLQVMYSSHNQSSSDINELTTPKTVTIFVVWAKAFDIKVRVRKCIIHLAFRIIKISKRLNNNKKKTCKSWPDFFNFSIFFHLPPLATEDRKQFQSREDKRGREVIPHTHPGAHQMEPPSPLIS